MNFAIALLSYWCLTVFRRPMGWPDVWATPGGAMTSKSDRDYYLARIAAEQEAAESAISDWVRAVHLELADKYRERLAAKHGGPPPVND